jgi:hypothetical protein
MRASAGFGSAARDDRLVLDAAGARAMPRKSAVAAAREVGCPMAFVPEACPQLQCQPKHDFTFKVLSC